MPGLARADRVSLALLLGLSGCSGGPSAADLCAKLVECDAQDSSATCEEDLDDMRSVLDGGAWSTMSQCLLDSSCTELEAGGFLSCLDEAIAQVPEGSGDGVVAAYCERMIACGTFTGSQESCESAADGLGDAVGILAGSVIACFEGCIPDLTCEWVDMFFEACGIECGLPWTDGDELCGDHGELVGEVCVCDAGYEGETCAACEPGYRVYDDECVEACTADTCSGAGVCSTNGAFLQCACEAEYSGERCELCASYHHKVGEECLENCTPDPCSGHGTCTAQPNGFSCSCAVGYLGDACDACWIDYEPLGADCVPVCPADPCSGHGTCEGTTGEPVCTCEVGYAGATCEGCASGYRDESGTCVLVCVPGACSDGGVCDGTSGQIVCDCYPNYTNEFCDACAPDHQPLDGTCSIPVVQLSAGPQHTCARLETGALRCWGNNVSHQLGTPGVDVLGDDEIAAVATDVEVGGAAIDIAAGYDHTCAVLQGGAVRCWGLDAEHQLGYPDGVENVGDDELPAAAGDVDVGGAVAQVVAGRMHTCARLETGAVRCWGRAQQLGQGGAEVIGDNETPASAGDIDLGGTATFLAVGAYHTCAVLADQTLRCWGNHGYGQLGVGDIGFTWTSMTPNQLGPISVGGPVIGVSCGDSFTCALLDGGAVRCWGTNLAGELGYGNMTPVGVTNLPSDVPPVDIGGAVSQIVSGGSHTCAQLVTGGGWRCWGLHGTGNPGPDDIFGNDEVPADLADVVLGGTVDQITAGGAHSCGLYADGRLRCWGINYFGSLGMGPLTSEYIIGDDETPSSIDFVPLFY